MNLADYFALSRGNQLRFAEAVGVHQPTVHQWATHHRPIPVEHGAAIERATGGAVTRQELFPKTWASIWPELASQPHPDEPLTLILAELRKQTTLLEVLAKQGDITVTARSTACADLCSVVRPATGAAASGLPG